MSETKGSLCYVTTTICDLSPCNRNCNIDDLKRSVRRGIKLKKAPPSVYHLSLKKKFKLRNEETSHVWFGCNNLFRLKIKHLGQHGNYVYM